MTAILQTATARDCRDCRWMNSREQCANPALPKLDQVRGKHHVFSCAGARTGVDLCGPSARLFEAKV